MKKVSQIKQFILSVKKIFSDKIKVQGGDCMGQTNIPRRKADVQKGILTFIGVVLVVVLFAVSVFCAVFSGGEIPLIPEEEEIKGLLQINSANYKTMYFEGDCPRETRLKIYCYIAACGLLWSNWCEFKRNLGVEFGEYSLRQYRYAKEYFRLFKAQCPEGLPDVQTRGENGE